MREINRVFSQPSVDPYSGTVIESIDQGWQLFKDRSDKSWSLVDCISFVVMEQNRLRDALTADHDFEQAGFRAMLLEEPD